MTRFPYRFALRDAGKRYEPLTEEGARNFPFHDRLNPDRYDVAFEVEWVTRTPVAANPCTDSGTAPCCPDNQEHNEYTGYNKRWLRVGGKPAISPFTVKTAVANGFANLLGGCIRVTTKEDPHADLGEGKYPYNGAYKRYRVSMAGKSKPGVIQGVNDVDGGKEFEIKVVDKEYYYNSDPLPIAVAPGTQVAAIIEQGRNRFKPWKIVKLDVSANLAKLKPTGQQKRELLIYHGPYFWGMDPYAGGASSTFGDRKSYRHRFYTLAKPAKTVKGTIPAWQFGTKVDLQEKMFMGRDQRRTPRDPNHRWFQEIKTLNAGDFVYYEAFNGEVAHIGRSFLFKAAFEHRDTVPDGQQECKDMRKLCPRCAMFGMTDATKRDGRPAVGFKGRFKASALVCDESLTPVEEIKEIVPVKIAENDYRNQSFPVKAWSNEKGVRCRQFLLPIQGQPKPNKRDVDGYFDAKTGLVKGIKTYRHSDGGVADIANLKHFIANTDSKSTLACKQPTHFVPSQGEKDRLKGLPYSHNLRSWVEVCDAGMTFTGTLGAENCSADEIAALVLLLEAGLPGAGHGFKIGTGKALGLGSVASHIKKIWVRKPGAYETWVPIALKGPQALEQALKDNFEGVQAALDRLKQVTQFERQINQMDQNHLPLAYPPPGLSYWGYADETGLNHMP